MNAKGIPDWTIIKIVNTDDVGIVRNELLPEGQKRGILVQFLDKTAVIISDHEPIEYVQGVGESVFAALANTHKNYYAVTDLQQDAQRLAELTLALLKTDDPDEWSKIGTEAKTLAQKLAQ